MLYIIYTIHVVICLFLIGVVLLQQGSGADLSVFGGGGTQTAFGARSATNLLHRLTVGGFIGFILTTIAFGFLKSGGSGGSVMSGVEQSSQVEAEPVDAQDAIALETTAPAGEVETPPVDPVDENGSGPTTGEQTESPQSSTPEGSDEP